MTATFHNTASAALIVVLACAFYSCADAPPANDSSSTGTLNMDTMQSDTTELDSTKMISVQRYDSLPPISRAASDRIKRFVTDDYPLPDEMFATNKNDTTSAREIRVNDVLSYDKAWFTSSDRQQTIVVELYTDMFRMIEYHFLNDNVPSALIERIELNTPEGEIATEVSKQKAFNGFIHRAKKISNKYFTSKKGFRLNDSKEKAIRIYGTPDSTALEKDIETLEWNFDGDLLYDGKTDLKGKPLAKNSYGHRATLMFRNNKLIAMILFNDIP